jgi:hypothetical protein
MTYKQSEASEDKAGSESVLTKIYGRRESLSESFSDFRDKATRPEGASAARHRDAITKPGSRRLSGAVLFVTQNKGQTGRRQSLQRVISVTLQQSQKAS